MAERRAALERLCARARHRARIITTSGACAHDVSDESLRGAARARSAWMRRSDAAIAAAERAAEARGVARMRCRRWRRSRPSGDALVGRACRLPQVGRGAATGRIDRGGGRAASRRASTSPRWPSPAQRASSTAWLARMRLALRVALPAGLSPADVVDGVPGATLLIAAPPRCYRPAAARRAAGASGGPRCSSTACARSATGASATSAIWRASSSSGRARGAGIVGLNPLHALFAHNPAHASPYSPSSRLCLNPLYIDVEAVDDLRECEPRSASCARRSSRRASSGCATASRSTIPASRRAKREVLELLYAHFRERHLAADSERARAFRAFQREARRRAAPACAVRSAAGAPACRRIASVWGWPVWPEEYRDPASPAVQRFVRTSSSSASSSTSTCSGRRSCSSRACRRTARARGLAVGLYLDLAVSVDRGGSDAWAHARHLRARRERRRAARRLQPPGPGLGPAAAAPGPPARRPATRSSSTTLRANMRHAGALRIDHVMGLMRLFWIPPGSTATRRRVRALPASTSCSRIVALESQRDRCLVIGEDLGTVPDEMRARAGRRAACCRTGC